MPAITGSVRVESRADGRVWVAKYMRACGKPTRKQLGRAWVRDSGKRTARGAIVWHSAGGRVPEDHLTPKAAQAALQELLNRERSLPQPPQPQEMTKTFGRASRVYLEYLEFDKEDAATTIQRYEGIVENHLVPWFGSDTPAVSIGQDEVEAYRSWMIEQGDLARSSMRQHMVVLTGILKHAKKKRWITSDPTEDVDRIRVPQASGEFNVLEPDQVAAVAAATVAAVETILPGRRNRTRVTEQWATSINEQRVLDAMVHQAVIVVAAFTGLRLGELRALRWHDIDFRDAIIHVRENSPSSAPAGAATKSPKSSKSRSVPLSEQAADALKKLFKVSRFTSPGDYVFPSPTGGMIDGGVVRDAFYAALDSAGLGHLRQRSKPIVLHDLRHTFGTLAVRVFLLTEVKEMMGHADISTTMRYVHYVPRHDAARRLSAAFAENRTRPGDEAIAA